MANENLLFRKGLQSKIKDLPVTPGAISITIDEPGMYIDLPANAALGHTTDYRVRIGDVITVYGLKELSDIANNITAGDLSTESATSTNTLVGKINKYSSSALYYVINQNMLLKYDALSEKFIWINDTSALENSLAALTNTVNGIGNRVTTLETTTIPNINKTIADNKKNLQDQIDAITGGAGVSLQTLQAAIEQEVKDRQAADNGLDGKITAINNNLKNYSTTAQMNAAIGTAKTELTTAIGTAKSEAIEAAATDAAAKVKVEKERAEAAESTLRQSITSINTSLNDYAKKADVYTKTEINTKVSDLNTAIDTAEADANKYTDAEIKKIDTAYKAADTALDGKIADVRNNLANNYYNKTSIDGKVDVINEVIATAQSTATTNAVSQAKTYTDTEVAKEKKRAEEAEAGLAQQIQQLSTSASSTYATKTELANTKTNLEGQIATAKSGAEATAKDYTDDEIAKIDEAYKAADASLKSTLEGQIQGVSTNLANNYYNKTTIDSKVTAINTSISNAQTNAEANAKSYTDTEIGKIDKAYKDADTALKNELAETINGVSANLTNNYYKKTQVYTKTETDGLLDTHLQEAKDYVDNVLDAAEAMMYKGTVTGANDSALRTALASKTKVEAGHVYVVASYTGTYHPGDLMIAAADGSGTDGKLAWSTTNWHHVKTGYDATLEQKLLSTAATNGGKVEIDSIGALDVGSVTFKAAADTSGNYTTAARVTMSTDKAGSGNNGTVTIGMVWTDF